MNTAVVYSSKTGHSKKIAEAIAKELKVQAQDIRTDPELQDIDILFIAGGIYAGKSSSYLMEYLNQISGEQVKRVFLITSSASGKTSQSMVRNELSKKGILVDRDEFLCKGSFLFVSAGHPTSEEVEAAVLFAKSKVTPA